MITSVYLDALEQAKCGLQQLHEHMPEDVVIQNTLHYVKGLWDDAVSDIELEKAEAEAEDLAMDHGDE